MNKVVTSLKKLSVSIVLIGSVSAGVLNIANADQVVKTTSNNQTDNVAKTTLIAQLAKVDFFSANFKQVVYDEKGTALQSAAGQLTLAKPNLVNFHTKTPEETMIISDGVTLWFFDPFIDQVTAHTLDTAMANTPILLLTSNDKSQWDNYVITDQVVSDEALVDKAYLIESKDSNTQVKSLLVNFKDQRIVGFDITDVTGQVSKVTLTDINETTKPDDSRFTFTIPEGIYLDDQR